MTHGLQNSAKTPSKETVTLIDRNPLVVQSDVLISQFISLLLRKSKNSSIAQLNPPFQPDEVSYLDELAALAHYANSLSYIPYALVTESNRIVGAITIQDLFTEKAFKSNLNQLTVAEVMKHPATLISGTKLKLFFKTFLHFKQYWLQYLAIADQEGKIQGVITPESLQQALQTSSENHNFLSNSPRSHELKVNPTISPQYLRLNNPNVENNHSSTLTLGRQSTYEALAQGTVTIQHLERQLKQKDLELERLQQQLQWQTRSSQILDHIAQTVHQVDSGSIATVLDKILLNTQAFLQAGRILIYQYQSDWTGFVLAEVSYEGLLQLQSFLIRDGFISDTEWIEQYQRGECCIVHDLEKDASQLAATNSSNFSQSLPALLQFFEVKSMLAVPILIRELLWGLIVIHHCTDSHEWQLHEINFVKSVALQLSVLIDRSLLIEKQSQLKVQLIEREREYTQNLSQTIAYTEMLQRITDRVRDSLDEQQILQTAVQELVTVLGIGYGQAVLCCNGNCEECQSCYQLVNYPIESLEEQNLAILPDLHLQLHRGEYCQFCLCEPFLNRGHNAILVCPIFDNQVYLGYLVLFASRSHQFEEAELRVVQQVANHCAIAIRQAQLYEASQAQVRELERLSQLKDDFLSTVSHELRTPLSSIKIVTNLLKIAFEQETSQTPKADNLNNKVAQYFNVLQEECNREIKLVNDLLEVQHLNAGNHPIRPSKINLIDWLPTAIENFNHRASNQQQQIELAMPDQPVLVTCDLFMLDRILTELVNNACKYTPSGELIRVTLTVLPTHFQLQISNTGVEIAEDQIPHIFKPFYRIPSNDPWKQGGTGLGLSLIKKIVEYLDGSIWVESKAGQVHFFVELPLQSSATLVEEASD